MENEKLFELMEKMYADLKGSIDELKSGQNELRQGQDELRQGQDELKQKLDSKADKSDIARIENTIIPKIEALFDGYKQNSEQLNRIEQEVAKHEEVILRRVK